MLKIADLKKKLRSGSVIEIELPHDARAILSEKSGYFCFHWVEGTTHYKQEKEQPNREDITSCEELLLL